MSKVYLIGAGPGDETLITQKAIKAIEACEVILYDRLSNDNLLSHAREDCEIYYCGKRPDSHYKTQDEINEMLVYHAKRGKIVGRIKGGDPYVFGRGGEEALRLVEDGIAFETVPGITSSIAVLNYAGIPMTHRGMAQSFHVFTGMTAEKLNIDWSAVSKLEGTLVFLMGLKNLKLIADSLVQNGKSKQTPAAVIMKGTTSKQRKVIGTIETIVQKAEMAKLESPCIIVFGEVVNLSEKLDWHADKPLGGLNICITRSKAQSAETREQLLDLGAEVTEINSIEPEFIAKSLDCYMEKLSDYDYIVLSSVNAVDYFFDELRNKDYDIRNLKAKFPAIGPKTALALKQRGIVPNIVAGEFVLESLISELKLELKPGDRVFHPKSELGRPLLEEELRAFGCEVDAPSLYKLKAPKLRGYESLDEVDVILFTSPSTVKHMVALFGLEVLSEKQLLAIGPITAAEIESQGMHCIVSESYTVDGMITQLLALK